MPLIERTAHIDHMQSLLREAAAGTGTFVLLEGEAGAGKSSLVEVFLRTASEGTRALVGACENFGTAIPLGPLEDIARQAKWTLTAGTEENWIALFSEILDSLAQQNIPTALVLEDIHWADDATLNLLRYLGRRLRGTCLLIVVTARNDDALSQTRLRRLIADIPAPHRVRIEVPPLSERAVIDLADHKGLDGQAIFRATGGNAYYVSEILECGKREHLPATIRDIVLARSDGLSQVDREVLWAASISPEAFDPDLVKAICGTDIGASLEACVACGLVVPVDRKFMFRHEIARQAVEQSIPPLHRRALNAKALVYFRTRGDASNARMVHHANEAQDSAAICDLAPKAALEAARLGAHRQAVSHCELALAHAGRQSDAERARLYESYAFECHVIGQMGRAIAAQTSALLLYRQMAASGRVGNSLRWLSRLNYLAGNRLNAETLGLEAVDVLEKAGAPAELAMAYSNLSQLAMLASDTETATLFGDKTVDLLTAEGIERPDIICHTLINVGSALCWRDPERARVLLDRGLAIALEGDFHEHAARGFTNRGWMEIQLFAPAAAEDFLHRGIAYCTDRDLDTWRDYMRGQLAQLEMYRGNWDEAAAITETVVDNENAPPLSRYPAIAALATLRTRRGESADHLLQEMTTFLETGAEFQRLTVYSELMAERAWLGLGDRDEAIGWLRRASVLSSDGAANRMICFWAAMLGEIEQAERLAGIDPVAASIVAGDWLEVSRIWNRRQAPYLSAVSLAQGDTDSLYQALSMLESIGACAAATHVKDMIRQRTGRLATRGPRTSTRENAAGLTLREMDVLRLVDQGLSNADVGAQLFVSPKTVDHHISAILGKLNVKSRGRAVAEGRRIGLI